VLFSYEFLCHIYIVTGYYRVNYDDESWKTIGDYLKQERICVSFGKKGQGLENRLKSLVMSYRRRGESYIIYSST
jgi:hypothetical protein